jgi:crotonobetainyl-CoA:carnitine CoA-transferase CaiB-like acyl-CoA transferase
MRVLDLSRLFPGPYCSRILADLGMEVIRVERPGGSDWLRQIPPMDPESGESLLFRSLNRGKKSLTLNLKSEEGRKIFLRLVKTADALLESFRPGVMDRLGLGYETLSQANPRLVYCSLTGYGTEGPYRQRAGHDLNYSGLSGLLDLTGQRDGPPSVPGAPLADLAGALWATIGILYALLERQRTGSGQHVESTFLGGALSFLPLAVSRQIGNQPVERGASDLTGGLVCYSIYQAGDGGYVTLAALEPQFWAAFCQAVGREDLLGQQYAPTIPGEPVYEELCALFRRHTRQEWAQLLDGVDACCEPVYAVEEALASIPVQALNMLVDRELLPPISLSAQQERATAPAYPLGEHTGALLAELGYDIEQKARFREQGVV